MSDLQDHCEKCGKQHHLCKCHAASKPAPEPGSASLVNFNVNDYVYVRLSDHGRECLRQNYDELASHYGGKLSFPFQLPTEDAEGWSKWQMWSLMQDLRQHISMGMNRPFDTEIRIELRKQNNPL